MKRRVVITGLGAVTPIGNTVENSGTASTREPRNRNDLRNLIQLNIKYICGEVKGFVAKDSMVSRQARRMGTFSQYAVAAAKEAFARCPAFPWRMKIRSASAFWWAPVSVI